jgi:type II secretory pathway component PulC
MSTYFDEQVEKKGIEHDIEVPEDPEAAGVIVLEPGQVVATTKLQISEKGVIVGTEDVLYKMPASDAEQDFAELSERMDEAEAILEEIPETYATLELMGEINELYNPEGESAVLPENRFNSLVEALGNLEESKVTLSTEGLTQSKSVAEQLIAIYRLASGVNEALGNRISILDARIEELENEVETLKNPSE